MRDIFLLLGSNRGNRPSLLTQALALIAIQAGPLLQASSVHETPPWGFTDPVPFLNQAIEIETVLPPEKLLETILNIESTLGRTRPANNFQNPYRVIPNDNNTPNYTARTIDIDLLFYGNNMIHTQALWVPHPRLHQRLFALKPLSEIAPGFVHPVLKKTVRELLNEIYTEYPPDPPST